MELLNSKLFHHIWTAESGYIQGQNRAAMSAFAHIRPDYIQHLNERISVHIDKALAEPEQHHLFSVLIKKVNYTFEVSKQGVYLNFIGIVSIDNLEFSETHYRLLMQTMRQVKHHLSHDLTHPTAAVKGLLSLANASDNMNELKEYINMALKEHERLDEEIIKLAKFL
jgi:signal transduction histidine kinase